MSSFQRSEVSFRRQGSSGLVWQDRFYSGDLNQMKREQERKTEQPRELRHSQSDGSTRMKKENKLGIIHRTSKVSPNIDPPSPKLSGCCFCGFGK
ncbi:hypothetical protein Pint_12680 [Pistacia integerrima]|uniref:Uncharacterized protein n=1 Tax=Pistacia integerrima TaxID=434235 RepID=A0ACC0Y9R1_9ROSI|nr:hypothetical protein Pint_12680 [Pistacia integerrima]